MIKKQYIARREEVTITREGDTAIISETDEGVGLFRVSQWGQTSTNDTNSWDSLGRLTRIDYPDSTYELFAYTNGAGIKLLDRTYHRDRLGHVQTWIYDGNRRVIRHTDPVGSVTAYEYCDCGTQPTRIVHAHGTGIAQTNSFTYNFQGGLLVHTLSEGSSTTTTYDTVGRIRVVLDVFGRTTNHFDNLGRLLSVSNAVGRLLARTYDHEDRPVITTDHNGISITNTYDVLGRLRTRAQPGNGKEHWGYTANIGAPTSYTNQINLVTLSAYDAAGRKTNKVQLGAWTNRFTYSPAGDLLSLIDGKNQTTSWVYDNDGRVKEKWYQGQTTADLVYSYNAHGLLINRLTRTGTGASTNGFNTVFRYNPVGSLTNVDYPAGTDLRFEYDALQRRTKMVDAIGTTTYTYTVGSDGERESEDEREE